MDAKERGQLIPDLPEELVLAHVVPRLPWFTRPLCRALSKSWRAVLDTRNAELDSRTRMMQLPALRGLFMICTFDKHIFIRDPDIHHPWQTKDYRIQPHWRKLPPLDGLVVPEFQSASMIASSGMVYAWSAKEGLNFVLKLDMGCAEWTWKKLPIPYPFDFDAICFTGKIYVPVPGSPRQKYGVLLVHDMMADKWRPVETWNQEDLRVVSKKCGQSNVHVEEMYCFVGDEFDPNVEVLMYDVESDSWRTHQKVPVPTVPAMRERYQFHMKLLNSDCFEPTSERGISIIWVSHECNSFFWFDSSIEKAWVEIGCDPVLEGRHLNYLECIHGSMYGIFTDKREQKEDTEKDKDGRRILRLFKTTIMKGRVIVASKSVAWEELHEVAFFQGRGFIDCYTVML